MAADDRNTSTREIQSFQPAQIGIPATKSRYRSPKFFVKSRSAERKVISSETGGTYSQISPRTVGATASFWVRRYSGGWPSAEASGVTKLSGFDCEGAARSSPKHSESIVSYS